MDATLDVRGRKRSPATLPGYNLGRIPTTKGRKFPADPMSVEDIVSLLQACKPYRNSPLAELSALRLRSLIVLLWRSGLRIGEALSLEERDLNSRDHTISVRHGKGDKSRISVMDEWGWKEFQPWLDARRKLPIGAVFCILSGRTAGRPLSATDVRRQLRKAADQSGIRRRVNPHALRHTLAVDLWKEGISEISIQNQLGHSRLDTTSIYLRGLTNAQILQPIAERRAPMMPIPNLNN